MLRSMLTCAATIVAALSSSGQLVPGEPAPPIAIEALENAPGVSADDITWDALVGTTVVLEFWATWCGPCIAAIPHLNELAESYADTDDVIFLSVTDEPVDLVNEFRTKREMKSWIGHDLDRDVLSAFGVRGIPRTFLIHDGRVMAETHPARLTREHIEIARRGEVVEELISEASQGDVVDRADNQGSMPLGRRDRVDMASGLDPYNVLDVTPAFQVIVREPDTLQTGVWRSDASVTMLGQSVGSIVPLLWGVPRHAVDLDESLEDTRFDVIVHRGDVSAKTVRPILAMAMGIDVERTTVATQGYRAVLDEGGLRLETSDFDETLGHSTRRAPDSVQIISESNTVSQLLALASSLLDAPIEDATALTDDLFSYSVIVTTNNERMPGEFLEATGIRLEPIETEVEGVVVRPIDR